MTEPTYGDCEDCERAAPESWLVACAHEDLRLMPLATELVFEVKGGRVRAQNWAACPACLEASKGDPLKVAFTRMTRAEDMLAGTPMELMTFTCAMCGRAFPGPRAFAPQPGDHGVLCPTCSRPLDAV